MILQETPVIPFVCVCVCAVDVEDSPPSDANGTEGSETGSTFSASGQPTRIPSIRGKGARKAKGSEIL